MIKETKDMCRIRLQGTVIAMKVTNKHSSIRIVTDGEKKADANLPEIICYSASLLKQVTYNSKVTVIGHPQLANVRQRDGSYRPQTIIIADLIRICPRRLLEYFDKNIILGSEGGIVEDANEFVLIGKKINSIEHNGVVNIRVSIEVNKEQKWQCNITCFKKQAEFMNMVEDGTKIACVGYVATNKKEVNGETKYYQNLVCRDIAVVKEEIQ